MLIKEFIIYNIIKQICKGIKEIHDKNIVHRDLKPKNIFMNKNGKIKIGDFGISKQLNSYKQYTSTKNCSGTLNYNSPEILNGGQYYNKKTDIWSLGCIIYELFFLKTYFSDRFENNIKNIEEDIYNPKWQEIINSSTEYNIDARSFIEQIIEKINNIEIDYIINKTFLFDDGEYNLENYDILKVIPDFKKMKEISIKISNHYCNSFSKDHANILENLVKVIYNHHQSLRNINDKYIFFHGTRDFYNLIKTFTKNILEQYSEDDKDLIDLKASIILH